MQRFAHLRHAERTDVGRKRTNNEDAFGVFPGHGVFCVSDGMGGGDDGEVASAATVQSIDDFCRTYPLPPDETYQIDDLVKGVKGAVNAASAWIFKRAQERRLKGCGATFVGICFDAANPEEAVALHAGDSRLYRMRGHTIQQITKDHSAAELIGAKDEKDVNPMFRGVILRAVGIQPSVEIEQTPLSVKPGDRILICSDGLSRMVPDKELLSISMANDDVGGAVDALIAAANKAGGIDNITAVLVEVGPLPSALAAVPLPFVQQEKPGAQAASRDAVSGNRIDTDSGSSVAPASLANEGQKAGDGRIRKRIAKAKRARFVWLVVGVILAVLLIGIVGAVVSRRQNEMAENVKAAEQRPDGEKSVAAEASPKLEEAQTARKKAAEERMRALAKADAEAKAAKKAREEAEAAVAAALEARRKAAEEVAAALKAKQSAEAESEIEAATATELKKKGDARRAENERRAGEGR